MLQELARIMAVVFCKDDLCARFCGEEFVILLPSVDIAETQIIAERLRQIVSDNIHPNVKDRLGYLHPATGRSGYKGTKCVDAGQAFAEVDGDGDGWVFSAIKLSFGGEVTT